MDRVPAVPDVKLRIEDFQLGLHLMNGRLLPALHTEVFLHQIAAFHKDVAETVSDFAVPEEEMSADKAELKQAGYECAESSTGNLHPRGTQMSENEYPVEEDVDKEGKNGTEQRDRDLSYTSKHNGAGQGKADTQIRRE